MSDFNKYYEREPYHEHCDSCGERIYEDEKVFDKGGHFTTHICEECARKYQKEGGFAPFWCFVSGLSYGFGAINEVEQFKIDHAIDEIKIGSELY